MLGKVVKGFQVNLFVQAIIDDEKCFENFPSTFNGRRQGKLTEGKGTVQLTSSLR
jgi:hypothetical protein